MRSGFLLVKCRESNAANAADDLTEIRFAQERLVKPVREIGNAHGQRNFDDLLFGEVIPQPFQVAITHGRGCAGDFIGKQNHRFFLVVEQLAAMVKVERLNLLVRDSNPLRRSGMGFGSILAAIHD